MCMGCGWILYVERELVENLRQNMVNLCRGVAFLRRCQMRLVSGVKSSRIVGESLRRGSSLSIRATLPLLPDLSLRLGDWML